MKRYRNRKRKKRSHSLVISISKFSYLIFIYFAKSIVFFFYSPLIVCAFYSPKLNLGFPDRILSVVNDSAPDPSIVNVIPDSQRKYASWMGGSMFASLTTFSLVQVTEQEYRENPRSIVHKKCFT